MKTLVCTVGGAPDPILAAIREHRPDRVIFVCSSDDPSTGAKGSHLEVGSKSPAIPERAGLTAGSWRVIRVPADDPAAAVEATAAEVAAAAREGTCLVDYTGGTKSMSAALFFVAMQTPGVRLSLVTGPRANLLRVDAGFERARIIAAGGIQRRRLEERVSECWSRHAYAEADLAITAAPSEARDADVDRWQMLSRGLAMWDAWDHRGALAILGKFGRYVGDLLPSLRRLAGGEDRPAEACRVVDMFASADRRARAHQFDSAVLRLYRALEWIAQWTLRWDSGIDAGAVPESSAMAPLASVAPAGNLVLGCDAAWRAVAELDGPLRESAATLGEGIRRLALKRNESVLAHGQRVLGREDFDACRQALAAGPWQRFLEASGAHEFQLPDALP